MDWHQAFSGQTLDRGLDYYHRGRIININFRDDSIEASVYGSRAYQVKIKMKDRSITSMKCDCPFAYDGNYCKHMAAVLFYADNTEPMDEHERPSTEKSLSELVNEADEAVVREFLTSILVHDEMLTNRFKSVLKCDISPEDMRRYKNQISKIFNRHAGLHGFIDYYHAGEFAIELENFLENEITGMVDNKQYEEAFELTNDLFIKLSQQEIDDSDGETEMLADLCLEIWQEILKHSDEPLQKKMFQWFIENINGSVIDYMEEYLEEIVFENFKEETFLAEKLLFTDKQVRKFKKEENSWSRSYAVGKWAIRHLTILEEQQAPETAIDEYCEKHLEFSKVRKYYIDRCINRNLFDKAIYLLEEGIKVDGSMTGLVRDYSLQLRNLYKKTGNKQAYKKELWSFILDYQEGDLDTFNELKELYSKDEWKEQREIIFRTITSDTSLADLFEAEKLYDRLLQIVLESPSLYPLQVYGESLKKIYPEELLNKYEATVRNMATHTSNRKRYQEIVALLKQMQTYPKGKQRVKEIITDWRALYGNRPAMMDELSRL
jgi:hypothetical protein